jgi:hypothetical protein
MTWECIECGDREQGAKRIPICHHCGKTVCRKHREMITDDAFSGGLVQAASHVAVHCLDCKREFHPRATNVEMATAVVRRATTP